MKTVDVVQYFMDKGYKPHQAAAIAGNLTQESSLNPEAINPKSKALGIGQWLGPRKKALYAFAERQGSYAADPGTQLDFIDHELNTTEKRAKGKLMASTNLADATNAFSNHYERAGAAEKNNAKRVSFAENALNAIISTASASEEPYQAPKKMSWDDFVPPQQAQGQEAAPAPAQPQAQPAQKLSWDDFIPPQATPNQPQTDQQFTQQHQQLQAAGNNPDAPVNPKDWSTVAGKAISNIPSSAMNFAENLGGAVMHPIDTLGGLAEGVIGGIQNLPGATVDKEGFFGDYRPTADKIGAFYKDRYGSMDGFKYALGSDPVGVLSDLSAVLGIGAGGLTKVAKVANIPELTKAATLFSKASSATNPVNAVIKPVSALTTKALPYALGAFTGTGSDTLKEAVRAGVQGGSKLQDFKNHMRDTNGVSFEDIVTDARGALGNLRTERGNAYKSGMTGINNDPAILDFSKVEDAANKAMNIGSYKGKVINRSAGSTNTQIQDLITEWKGANPAEFHTAAGIDALKQAIGDVRDSTQFGTPARVAADRVYLAAVAEITKQAPAYAKVMKDYSDNSKQLTELTKTLSLGEKASKDTAIRKMQSMTRNNVITNFGARNKLGKVLEQHGADNLLAKVAGQSLNSWTPRGITGAIAPQAALGIAAGAANPLLLSGMVLQSPRLMGEAAAMTGRLISPVHSLANTSLAKLLDEMLLKNAPYVNSAYQQGGKNK
jgi:hypothetical protein